MRLIHALVVGAIALLGAATGAVAQRGAADRADHGQRLDSDAFRNDMLQDQLKKQTDPQSRQGITKPGAGDKSKPSVRKPKPN